MNLYLLPSDTIIDYKNVDWLCITDKHVVAQPNNHDAYVKLKNARYIFDGGRWRKCRNY